MASESLLETSQPVPATLSGRCSNGAERDRGRLVHAIPDPGSTYPVFGKALCGAKPGRTSAGWNTETDKPVTCSRCLKRMEKESRG